MEKEKYATIECINCFKILKKHLKIITEDIKETEWALKIFNS